MHDVVAEARAIESAKQTNKLIVHLSKGTDEEVHWTGLRYSQMKLRREPGTCFWCGYPRGAHPWRVCPAKGKRPVHLAVAMIILPAFVWKILRLQYQIPDSKLPTLDMVGRPRMDNNMTHNRVASDMNHVQIHLPSHETFTTLTCMSQRSSNMTYPMIMIEASHTPWKHNYTASRLPAWQSDTLRPDHFPCQAQHSLKSSFK